jgi:flagellar hook assembly protein FlgD
MWDGRNDQGIVQPKGPYKVQVIAKNSSDATVAVDQQTKGTVEAVSFDKGYPVLELSNGVNVPVGDLLSLER